MSGVAYWALFIALGVLAGVMPWVRYQGRIRKLEAANDSLNQFLVVETKCFIALIELLQSRISNAKEVLGPDEYGFYACGNGQFQIDLREKAIAALEGK